jgi:hypothetical protein
MSETETLRCSKMKVYFKKFNAFSILKIVNSIGKIMEL